MKREKEELSLDRYLKCVADEITNVSSNKASDNIIKFYEENKKICDTAYRRYEYFTQNINEFVRIPERVSEDTFLRNLKNKKVLVLTSNPIEHALFDYWLSDFAQCSLQSFTVGNQTYIIYNYTSNSEFQSEVSIIHVKAERIGSNAARRALDHAFDLFIPDSVIALGVCYGFDYNKFKVGNVIVSDSVTSYNVNFRDTAEDEVPYELDTQCEVQPSHAFLERIKQLLREMNIRNLLSDTNAPIFTYTYSGKVISIDSVVSEVRLKSCLLEGYKRNNKKPLGGEMEGGGILQTRACMDEDFTHWVIMKSICDWGEMKNGICIDDPEKNELIKHSIQAYAMSNSCSVFNSVKDYLYEV